MLLTAASQQTNVPLNQLKTKEGNVLLPDGKLLSYISLAAAAGKLDRPSDVTLKPVGEWR